MPLPTRPTDWATALLAGPRAETSAPPYPGAVQDELAWHLAKHLRADALLRSEVAVEIPASDGWPEHGTGPAFFTIDLLVEVPVGDPAGPVRRVAFEAAGRGPSGRSLRDHDRRLRRDATLLATGAVDTVYRLRGDDLVHHIEDVLYLASRWERSDGAAAGVFSERGQINLSTLASAEAQRIEVRPEQPSALVPYAPASGEGDAPDHDLWAVAHGQAPHVLVRRLDRRFADVWAPYAQESLRRVEPAADRWPLRKAS